MNRAPRPLTPVSVRRSRPLSVSSTFTLHCSPFTCGRSGGGCPCRPCRRWRTRPRRAARSCSRGPASRSSSRRRACWGLSAGRRPGETRSSGAGPAAPPTAAAGGGPGRRGLGGKGRSQRPRRCLVIGCL